MRPAACPSDQAKADEAAEAIREMLTYTFAGWEDWMTVEPRIGRDQS
jgi:hypothetical protein